MSLFEVVERGPGQRVAVAVQDILPGTALFTDEPLIVADGFSLETFHLRSSEAKRMLASYVEKVMRLPNQKKEKYFNLCTTRQFFIPTLVRCMMEENLVQAQNVKLFEDAASVFFANAIVMDTSGGQKRTAVYEKWSFVKHSCDGNCIRTISDKSGTAVSCCRAGRCIKAGECLTICSIFELSMSPTHERRGKLLTGKCFTCHCQRCDAEGDDTRQFDCFDAVSRGRHFVQQPISHATQTIPGVLCFEGVEHVEPHLLPCTVCRRFPPPEYQEHMLRLEERLFKELARLNAVLSSTFSAGGLVTLYEKVKALPLPAHHPALVYQACALRLKITTTYTEGAFIHSDDWPDVFQSTTREDIDAAVLTESTARCTTFQVRDMWCKAAGQVLLDAGTPALAKYVVQKYLQVHCIMFGREDRIVEIERNFLEVLNRLPTPQEVVDMTVCAFCEESPQRAALTLSKCARCRKVAYCSKGCQKAHWPLHKKQCSR